MLEMLDWVAQSEEVIIPIIAIVVVIGGPILLLLVNTLLRHQRQMSEAMRQGGSHSDQIARDLTEIKSEMKELKEVLLSHSLSLEGNMDGIRRRLEGVEQRSSSLDIER
jgi:hypothetical protein